MDRWSQKLTHDPDGALYTWEGLATPYQKKDAPKFYPPIEMEGQDW